MRQKKSVVSCCVNSALLSRIARSYEPARSATPSRCAMQLNVYHQVMNPCQPPNQSINQSCSFECPLRRLRQNKKRHKSRLRLRLRHCPAQNAESSHLLHGTCVREIPDSKKRKAVSWESRRTSLIKLILVSSNVVRRYLSTAEGRREEAREDVGPVLFGRQVGVLERQAMADDGLRLLVMEFVVGLGVRRHQARWRGRGSK